MYYPDFKAFIPSSTVFLLNLLIYSYMKGKLILMFSSVAPLGTVANVNGGLNDKGFINYEMTKF